MWHGVASTVPPVGIFASRGCPSGVRGFVPIFPQEQLVAWPRIQFGINEASLLRLEIPPNLVVPLLFIKAVVFIVFYYHSRGFFVLVIPKLLPWPLVDSASVGPWERCMWTCKLLQALFSPTVTYFLVLPLVATRSLWHGLASTVPLAGFLACRGCHSDVPGFLFQDYWTIKWRRWTIE